MITARAVVGKYFFSEFINLGDGSEGQIDLSQLTPKQLELLDKAEKTGVLVFSQEDLTELKNLIITTPKTDSCCNTNAKNVHVVELQEDDPLPPYNHPSLRAKEDKHNKTNSIVSADNVSYPTTKAVVEFVRQITCNSVTHTELSNYVTKEMLHQTSARKVSKEVGKTLSQNDFTNTYKGLLDNLKQIVEEEVLRVNAGGSLSIYNAEEIDEKLEEKADKTDLIGLATETSVITVLSNFAASLDKLAVVTQNVQPVVAEGVPIYTLGADGSYVLCEPDEWVEIKDGLVIPAYKKSLLGL